MTASVVILNILALLTVTGFIWVDFEDIFDIDNYFINKLLYMLFAGAIWMIILGSISIANTSWFIIHIPHKSCIWMIVIGILIILLFILAYMIYDGKFSCFNSRIRATYYSIKSKRLEHKIANLSEDSNYYDSSYKSYLAASEHGEFHVILSKTQSLDMDELEINIKEMIESVDGKKYNKGEILNSFKLNGYFIVASFDLEEEAREFKNNLRDNDIKSSVCEDSWLKSVKQEFNENKNSLITCKLRFGETEYFYIDNK